MEIMKITKIMQIMKINIHLRVSAGATVPSTLWYFSLYSSANWFGPSFGPLAFRVWDHGKYAFHDLLFSYILENDIFDIL